MIKNHFKSAWRSIWKNRTTSCINIAGLSIGMTAAVLILLWVQNETSFDNYKNKDNIYRLTTRIPANSWVWETTSLLLAPAIKNEVPEIEKVARLYTNNLPVFKIKGSLVYEKNSAYVDDDWFNIFEYEFIEGNFSSFNDNPFSIIITKSEARRYFGKEHAVGQTIHVDSMDYQVRGVVADPPINSSFQYTAFMPLSALLTNQEIRKNDEQWGNDNYVTFVKTLPGSSADKIAGKINQVVRNNANGDGSSAVSMISLKDMHFESEIDNSAFVHGNRNTMYIFSFLGFLLLLVACINYVNLATARSSLRAKEVSIRKMTGASRWDLFMQFVTESVLISLISLVTTILLIQLFLPVFNGLTGKIFTLPLTSPDLWKVLATTICTALLLNSIYPALLLSSFKPLNVFRGNTVLKVNDSSFRKALVVLQFTISVILISGSIVIYRQMQFVQKTNPGYNRSQVLSFMLPFTMDRDKKDGLMRAIKQELISQSVIENVGTSNQPVVNIGSMCTECVDWPGRDTSFNPRIAQLSADAGFQKTMQLQMKEGGWFEEGNPGRKNFILNETAVKEFGLHSPVVGQIFIFKGDTGHISGVVKDFYYKSMREKMGPVVVFNNPIWQNHFVVRAAAKNAGPALTAIEKTWKKYIPGSPLEYNFLDDTFNNLYKQDQQTSFLILVFAVIAVFISALGLFSLSAFEAAQRKKEIGIRKVLGCTVTGIATLLSRDFVKLVAIAIVIASPAAWWAMNRWLRDFEYRININWQVFALSGLLAIAIALFTVSFQAIKAAVANPVNSLRTE